VVAQLTDDPLFDRRPSVRRSARLVRSAASRAVASCQAFVTSSPSWRKASTWAAWRSRWPSTPAATTAALLPASDIGLLLHRRSTLDIVLPGMGEPYTPSEISPEYVTEATEISSAAGRFRQAPEVLQLLPGDGATTGRS
jgi:hypothetical protein